MEQIFNNIGQSLEYFILLFFRVTALVVSSPIFGRKTLPNALKIALCLVIAYIVFSAYPAAPSIQYGGIFGYALLCIMELLFGLVLGYVTTLFFSVVQTAGHVIDMQMGFGMVNVFDVQNNVSMPVSGSLLNIVLLVTFFSVNGHLQLVRILIGTFEVIPVGSVVLSAKLGLVALEVFALAFVLAANVAMPMIAAGLLSELLMGIIVRTVPQVNMFVVGIPLKIILGFLVLLMVLPFYVSFTDTIFKQMFLSIQKMFVALAGSV